jgi:hypothetical protein
MWPNEPRQTIVDSTTVDSDSRAGPQGTNFKLDPAETSRFALKVCPAGYSPSLVKPLR